MKNLNKIISLVISFIIIICSMSISAFASDGILSGVEVDAISGETVTMPISFSGNSGSAYLQFGIKYNKDYLKLTDATTVGIFSEGSAVFSLENGVFSWATTENASGDGELLSLTFDVDESTPTGVYPIEIVFNQCLAITDGTNTESISVTTENGAISVKNDSDAKIYTVTLKDGDTIYELSRIKENEKVGSMANKKPSKDGYDFKGWFDGDNEITADTVVTSDITASAVYTEKGAAPKKYTVTYKNGDETVASYEINENETIGDNIPESPEKSGYVFEGWYLGTTKVDSNTVVNGNMTFDAKFSKKSSGGSGGSSSGGSSSGGSSSGGSTSGGTTDSDNENTETKGDTPTKPDDSNQTTDDAKYVDITSDDWAYDAIMNLSNKGIISGYDSKIRPDDGITRQEVSKILLAVKGEQVDETLALDVVDGESVSDWAKQIFATAMNKGYITGYSDGTVKGDKTVTRAELATMIVRALKITTDDTESTFTDVASTDWFCKYVEAAKKLGIITGYSDGSFAGNNLVTRREAFAMADRMLKLYEVLNAE